MLNRPSSAVERTRTYAWARWLSALVAIAAVAGFALWHRAGQPLMDRMYEGRFLSFFVIPPDMRAAHSAAELYARLHTLLLGTAALTIALAAAIWVTPALLRTQSSARRSRIAAWTLVIAASLVVAALLYSLGYEGEWYRIDRAMAFSTNPPSSHRVFFVLLGILIQAVTGVSALKSYFLTQCAAIVLAMWAVWHWAELFVPREIAVFAPVLAALMLAPTISFYTFYDFGIVFFFAAGLLLLFQGRTGLYLALLVCATLNHEVVLFLIFAAAFLYHDRYSRPRWLAFVAAQLAIYGVVRAILFTLIPVPRAWAHGSFWRNVEWLVVRYHSLAHTLVLFVWFAVACWLIWRVGPNSLKRCLIVLPLLLASTLLVGNLNETRQFVAFIPIAVAGILHAIRHRGVSAPISVPGETAAALPVPRA